MKTKNIYFISLLLITIFACNRQKNSNNGSTQQDSTLHTTDKLEAYQTFINQLDSFSVESATLAAKKYQELFSDQDQDTNDKAYIIFDSYYKKLTNSLNATLEKDTVDYSPLFLQNNDPVSQNLKDYQKKLKENGFQVASIEGMAYIEQDRDFVLKWFENKVSATMREYLQEKNKENKEGFMKDAGLVISGKQYVNRLIWLEKFTKDHNSFYFADDLKQQRKRLLAFFLTGVDNTPLFVYSTRNLNPYYKGAYTYLQNTFPNSETNHIVSPYFQALQTGNNKKADELIAEYKRKQLIEDLSKL